MTTAEWLFEQALELDEAERTELADRLYESVTGGVTPEWEKAWIAEIERRDAEHLAGNDPEIPWEEVRESAMAPSGVSRCSSEAHVPSLGARRVDRGDRVVR